MRFRSVVPKATVGVMPQLPRWGLSPLDWHAHAIDEYADHPHGVYVARCGHRLLMGTCLNDEPSGPDLHVLRPLERPVSSQHPGEIFRHAIDARCVREYGSRACTILVRRVGDRVELLFHAALNTGAALTREEAAELFAALREAAR
jgi:hypothetical protein